MENYIMIKIDVPDEHQDFFYSVVSDWPCDVFSEEGPLITTAILKNSFSQELKDQMDKDMAEHGWKIVYEEVQGQNWNEAWEGNFPTVEVGNFARIRAPFHRPLTYFKHDIVMVPKMAFGTGHHETTYMMVEWMQKVRCLNKRVWDFGCGTAILAILAAKEGASYVFANDIEATAVASAQENADMNGVALVIKEGGIEAVEQEEPFDLVLANITKNILKESATQIFEHMVSGGTLLLSGILVEDIKEVKSHFESMNFMYVGQRTKGNWVSLRFIRMG
jgi:ribosomal protein L11 methyltransferase